MKPHAIRGAMFAVLLVLGAGLAGAAEPAQPILKYDTKAEIELDLAAMVDDLLPLLDQALAGQQDEDLAKLRDVIDLLGLRSLDRLQMKTESDRNRGRSRLTVTLDTGRDTGLLGEELALPDGRCGFARYLDLDGLTLMVSVQNMADQIGLALDVLNRPEFAEATAELPRNADGELDFGGFCPRRDVLPLLSGELDVVMLDLPGSDTVNPMALPAYLVLGASDGPALRDLILATVDRFSGEEGGGIAQMIRSLPVEQVGDFELTVSPFGASFAVSRDFLVIGLAADPLRELLARADGSLDVPDGRTWMYMNGREYGRAMSAFLEMAGGMGAMQGDEDGEAQWLMRMYSEMFAHLESETVRTWSRPDRLVVEADVRGNLMQGLYAMLRGYLVELPDLLERKRLETAEQEAAAAYQDAIAELDFAFMQYAEEHDGRYPADARELVTAGYLEEFPLSMAVPAGTYVDGAYTYHPLYDAAGEVTGYFLFAYGGGEGTGYDVYTPGNVAGGDFVIGSDGVPDGVIAFCYDGTATDQMQNW